MKRKVGRPAHEPSVKSRRQVEMMAAFGNTEEQIAAILGVSAPTLRLHYRPELDLGHVKASNAVALNLWRQATKDDPRCAQAAMFWLRCRAGWSEYAPPPAPRPSPKPEQRGKKAAATEEAKTAHEGNSWGHVLQ